MTKLEAIEYFQNKIDLMNGMSGGEFREAMELAIAAIEKQIPKKPFKLNDTLLRDAGWIYGCPTCKCACGENKCHYEVTVDDAYCTQCGQMLDWDD